MAGSGTAETHGMRFPRWLVQDSSRPVYASTPGVKVLLFAVRYVLNQHSSLLHPEPSEVIDEDFDVLVGKNLRRFGHLAVEIDARTGLEAA